MFKTFYVAALATGSILMMPQSAYAEGQARENCRTLEETAKSIMEARQEGVAMSKLIELAEQSFSDQGDAVLSYVTNLVIIAYEQPRYSSSGYKTEAAEDFANEVYLSCFKSMSD